MDTSKIIKGVVNSGRYTVTAPIVKEDYGLYLQIEGVELPQTYEVDFSNSENSGTSVTMIGNSDGVLIPRQFIDSGKDVFAFLYHAGADYGRTVYKFRIPNKVRPDRTNEEPTPEEQSVIDQAINALNEAVATASQKASDADASAQSASADADRAESARDNAQTYANNAQTSANNASASAQASANSASASAQSASQSAQIKADVEELERDAQAAANSCEISARASGESALSASNSALSSSEYASNALGYAESASESAQTASTKASEASTSASTASAKATESAQSATNAQGYAQTAEQAKTDAQTAKTQAETARDNAVAAKTAAETAQGKAEDAQAAAESVAESIPSDYSQLSDDVSDLKEGLSAIYPSVADSEVSTNVVTFNDYSGQTTGINYSVVDDLITINGTASETTNIYLYYKNYSLVLTAGNYVMTVDDGLVQPNMDVQVIGFNQVLQNSQNQKAFTLASDTSNTSLRIRFEPGTTVSWTGHFWINPNTAQKYIPKGKTLYTPKALVEEYQGEENSGKVLAVGTDGNVTLINNAVDNVASKTLYKRGNLLDYSKVTKGYIKADGTVQTYNSLWCSGYIPMYGDTVYCNISGNGNVVINMYFAFYDDNKDLVASYDTIGSMQKATATIYYVAVPSGAKYFRCTFTSDQSVTQTAWISNDFEKPYPEDVYNIDNVYPFTLNPSNPCDYSELTVRAFSKVVCIGDSLTWGGFNMDDNSSSTGQTVSKDELAQRYSYPSCFQRITGVDTANKGTSGVTAAQWYTQFQSDDFSEFDLAIIFLGVNDSAQHVSDADTLTAMQNIVTMLNTARSDMRIAICSCIPAYNSTWYQAKGQLILNWAKGLNDPNIIPLDLAQYSHVRPQTSYVAGHMSALGYYMMALDIARYISWYMDHHKRDFRFIQFIGSPDASWTGD